MNILGILFSDTYDDRLKELAAYRTMASVPFGGRYRVIDFILSSFVNAGIYNIGVVTKSNYGSLADHLRSGKDWDLDRKNGGLRILSPSSWNRGRSEYKGKLDALADMRQFIASDNSEYAVLADCNKVCNLDIKEFIQRHIETGADITMLCVPAVKSSPGSFTIKADEDFLTRDTAELCTTAETIDGQVSAGIYILKRSLLLSLIDSGYTFGYNFERECIEPNIGRMKIGTYLHTGVFFMLNTVREYFEANRALFDENVRNGLFMQEGRKILTRSKDTAPTVYAGQGSSKNSLVADGCRIEGSVENSIIFRNVHIKPGASVRDSIVMEYSVVGADARIEYVILDKYVQLSDHCRLLGFESSPVVLQKYTKA